MTSHRAADLAIVVVTYNSAHVIEDLLDSLPAALGNATAEVLVVDNGSRDGTADRIRSRGGCTVVDAPNLGYAHGINVGVEHASSDLPILVLNPDLTLAPGSVPIMLSTLAEPRVGIVAPRVLDGSGDLLHSLRREPTLVRALGLTSTRLPKFSEYYNRAADYEQAHDVDWALGAALLVDRRCHEELGGWDASFFLYSEETDFCLRAREAGWVTRYQPSAVVFHVGKQSGYDARIHSMQIVNRVRLFRRRHGTAASTLYFGLAVASEGYRAMLGRRMHRESVKALLLPNRRPPELGAAGSWLPR